MGLGYREITGRTQRPARRAKRLRRHAKRIGVFIVGWLVIIFGLAIGWLPGPGGIPVVLAGLAILATEFEWAERLKRRLIDWVTERMRIVQEKRAARKARKSGGVVGVLPPGEVPSEDAVRSERAAS